MQKKARGKIMQPQVLELLWPLFLKTCKKIVLVQSFPRIFQTTPKKHETYRQKIYKLVNDYFLRFCCCLRARYFLRSFFLLRFFPPNRSTARTCARAQICNWRGPIFSIFFFVILFSFLKKTSP